MILVEEIIKSILIGRKGKTFTPTKPECDLTDNVQFPFEVSPKRVWLYRSIGSALLSFLDISYLSYDLVLIDFLQQLIIPLNLNTLAQSTPVRRWILSCINSLIVPRLALWKSDSCRIFDLFVEPWTVWQKRAEQKEAFSCFFLFAKLLRSGYRKQSISIYISAIFSGTFSRFPGLSIFCRLWCRKHFLAYHVQAKPENCQYHKREGHSSKKIFSGNIRNERYLMELNSCPGNMEVQNGELVCSHCSCRFF